jgi:urocanate hydratase
MALNLKIALYRGTEAHLAALASTGQAGVLALATDTNELFIDQGSGTAGIGNLGSGAAWIRAAAGTQVFTVASQVAMLALSGALVGDLAVRTDVNQVFMLTAQTVGAYSTLASWTQVGVIGTAIVGLSGATAHQWVQYVDTSGVQHLTQPAFADISGTLAQTQLPATIGAGSNLTSVDCGTF